MITVTILYPDGERREGVILAATPARGDDIRLNDMKRNDPSLVVEHRTFPEAEDVIISVRERPNER